MKYQRRVIEMQKYKLCWNTRVSWSLEVLQMDIQFGLSFHKEGQSGANWKFPANYLHQAKFKSPVVPAILQDSSTVAFSGDDGCDESRVHTISQPNFFDQNLVSF